MTAQPSAGRRLNGPGRLLVWVYALFAVAASARATVQIATRFDDAPIAYVLSAIAAVIYLVNCVLLGGRSARSWRLARAFCVVELLGVVVVGIASFVFPAEFPDATVWSHFGSGYGFIPLVLPVLGLAWLGSTRPAGDLARQPDPETGRADR